MQYMLAVTELGKDGRVAVLLALPSVVYQNLVFGRLSVLR
jgi:hypothetical protein